MAATAVERESFTMDGLSKEKLVVQHVENTSYENDLKEALGYGEEIYFYKVEDVLANLDLDPEGEFQPRYGDVAFLVSNQALSDDQLREEVEPYIPQTVRKQHLANQLARQIGEQIDEAATTNQFDATAVKETVRGFMEFMERADAVQSGSLREAIEAFDGFLDDILDDGSPYEIKTNVTVSGAVVIVDLDDRVLRLDSAEIAREERECERQMAGLEQARVERESQRQQQITAVLEHLRGCKRCTVSFYDDRTMQFSGPNFTGELCDPGYKLIQPLVTSCGIYWRGHRPRNPDGTFREWNGYCQNAPTTAIPQQTQDPSFSQSNGVVGKRELKEFTQHYRAGQGEAA